MKNPDPGYPLPPGEAYTDDFACQLIYIPRNDFYYRAFLGALLYMGTWTAWERDDAKRGKDAARAWQEANELTWSCWRMTNCLDDITDRMDEIIHLISLRKDCCDDNVTYGPQTEVETEIEPDVGDPPAFYGETAVTDWEDWAEHVCHNAHIYVDILKHKAAEMDTASVNAAWTIGLIAAGLAALSFVGIGLAIVYGLAALTAGSLLAASVEGVFTNTEDDIEAARQNIICALLQGTSLAEAVEDALSSGLDWDLFFQFSDYDSATAILYEGGYEQEYLPPDIRDDCECAIPDLFLFEPFNPDYEGLDYANGFGKDWVGDNASFNMITDQNEVDGWTTETGDEIATRFGLSTPIVVNRLTARFKIHSNGASVAGFYWGFDIVAEGDVAHHSGQFTEAVYTKDVWHEIEWEIGYDVTLRQLSICWGIFARRFQPWNLGQRLVFEWVGGSYV